jgi:hypothetical protein
MFLKGLNYKFGLKVISLLLLLFVDAGVITVLMTLILYRRLMPIFT